MITLQLGYTKYLENLRQYKADTEHKKVYAWFDNSEKNLFSRAQHLTDLPDSLDAVVLIHPENLVERELQEIESIRSNKNTKVIYSISFDEIKAAYNQSMESEAEAEPIAQDFLSYMVDTLQHALSIADKYSALTESRAYKKSMTPKQALTIIYQDVKDGKLHPFVFKALVNYAAEKSINSTVA